LTELQVPEWQANFVLRGLQPPGSRVQKEDRGTATGGREERTTRKEGEKKESQNRKPRKRTKKTKKQNNGEHDAEVLVGHTSAAAERPVLLASTTQTAHTGAGATPRNWLPAGTDGPSTEQR
jgi:hypothetical protein